MKESAPTAPAGSTAVQDPSPAQPVSATTEVRRPAAPYTGGLFVVEGIDGSGKSTQLYLLRRWLQIGGYRVHFTEWDSSPLVKSATRRGKQERLLTPTPFSLLHAADFADRCERQIRPLLYSGYLVLADRYIYAAFARDAARGCSPGRLRNLYRFAPSRRKSLRAEARRFSQPGSGSTSTRAAATERQRRSATLRSWTGSGADELAARPTSLWTRRIHRPQLSVAGGGGGRSWGLSMALGNPGAVPSCEPGAMAG